MTKKQTKKQPIKVQMSKLELAELLNTLKKFIYENILVELNRQSKRIFLNCSELDKRITSLEIVENNHRAEIHKLKQHCTHSYKLISVVYHTKEKDPTGLCHKYKCKHCGHETYNITVVLSRREKRALKMLGVKL